MTEKFVVRRCEPYINSGLHRAPRGEYRMRHVRFHGASNLKNPKGEKREEHRRQTEGGYGSPLLRCHWLCYGPGGS